MKKHLLLASVALLSVSSVAFAQLPDPSTPPHSTNLTLNWYAAPTGTCATASSARSGIGVNGKFYVVMQDKGVAIFNQEGQIKEIDNKTAWVSINCDDAGHVYFRNDKQGWTVQADGNYVSDNAQFCVIDSKSDEIIKANVPMKSSFSCRFDALPHVMGDMVAEFVDIPCPLASTGNIGADFMYNQLEQQTFVGRFNIADALKEGGFPAPANTVQTLASAQFFAPDGDGIPQKMAVLPNNHIEVTSSTFGWGNNVALYNYNEESDSYVFSGKWFVTPNHSAVGGFCMFTSAGNNYICYPAGTTGEGSPAGDGFFVMKEELVDTPKNLSYEDADYRNEQLHKATAYKYATDGIGTGNNYRGINVEPVQGEDGKFTIYHYNPGVSMEVWTLDLSGSTGIEDIVADTDEAKIFGGIGVVVTQSEAPAQVYTLAGQLVAQGKGTIAVPAGVYVVKADNKAAKVIVK